MSDAPLLEEPDTRRTTVTALSRWSAVIRATRRSGEAPPTSTESLVALAARLGIDLAFDDLGYEACFDVVGHDQDDAVTTAHRRWFYLATDLGVPMWPVSDVRVASPSH